MFLTQIFEGMVRTERKSVPTIMDVLAEFLPMAVKELNLTQLPKIKPVMKLPTVGDHGSFGGYDSENHCIYLAVGNRHPNDILRTLAHELAHAKQRTDNRLSQNGGETGSDEENEANAQAGVLMRKFADLYPESFNAKPITKNLPQVR